RVLVDRLWPRGLSKDAAKVDLWLKEIAPSDALRKWFAHDPEKWQEFQKRYVAELQQNDAALDAVRAELRKRHVTLLYAAEDEAHNNAVVLRSYLTQPRGRNARAPRIDDMSSQFPAIRRLARRRRGEHPTRYRPGVRRRMPRNRRSA